MTKTALTAALALALTTGLSAPAYAGDSKHRDWIPILSVPTEQQIGDFVANPTYYLISLLLPAVQKG